MSQEKSLKTVISLHIWTDHFSTCLPKLQASGTGEHVQPLQSKDCDGVHCTILSGLLVLMHHPLLVATVVLKMNCSLPVQ